MTALKRTCYDDPTDAELARWPGVTWFREPRGKHNALVLTFDGVSRFVIYPTSPGDSMRGPQNHIANVRQALRGLGAVREVEARSLRPRRKRVRVQQTARLVRSLPETGASPERDPWAALASLEIKPATKPSLWARVLEFFRKWL